MKKFVETFPFLPQLEGLVPTEKSNKSTKWVCPCSAKVYNNLLSNWFPCNHQDKFLLNEDNSPCSKGRGDLYETDMVLMKH